MAHMHPVPGVLLGLPVFEAVERQGVRLIPPAAIACYRGCFAPIGATSMKNGMVIIDADGHAVDAEPVYRERLPERYRKRNFIHPSDGFDRNQNGTISKRPETPAQNLADNDREGIDLQIIYPTGGLFLSRVREADYAIALSGATNAC